MEITTKFIKLLFLSSFLLQAFACGQGLVDNNGPVDPVVSSNDEYLNRGTRSWTDGSGQVTTDVNVGMGTDSPSEQLEVDGNVVVSGWIDVAYPIEILNDFGWQGVFWLGRPTDIEDVKATIEEATEADVVFVYRWDGSAQQMTGDIQAGQLLQVLVVGGHSASVNLSALPNSDGWELSKRASDLEVSGELEVSGYTKIGTSTGAPPATDCDDPSEHGRMKVDPTEGVSLLYICTGDGWVAK